MATEREILLFQVDDAIESLEFHIRMEHGTYAVQSAVDYALLTIENVVSKLPNDDPFLVDLFQKKELVHEYEEVYGVSPESQKYNNLRTALYFRDIGELDQFDIEDAVELIEEIKDSDNYYDKLAIGIIADLLGEEYALLRNQMIDEYLMSGSSTILISNDEIISTYK